MNAQELKNFYETSLGKFACRKLRAKILNFWPEASKEKILGFGFALPYLPLFSYGNSVIALSPQSIGAVKIEDAVFTALADTTQLPSANEFFDRVLLIHGIEHAEIPEKLIEEAWRILKPNGKLLIIAPHEGGVWLRNNSPFYRTKAYSRAKLIEFLFFNKFYVRRTSRALFFIPTNFKALNVIMEFFGSIFLRPFCGVLIIEAEKRIFAPGGRPIKIPVSIWDKVFKPKVATAMES